MKRALWVHCQVYCVQSQEYVEHGDEHAVEQMELEAVMKSVMNQMMEIRHRNTYLTLLVSCVVQ